MGIFIFRKDVRNNFRVVMISLDYLCEGIRILCRRLVVWWSLRVILKNSINNHTSCVAVQAEAVKKRRIDGAVHSW